MVVGMLPMPHGYAERTPQRASPRSGVDSSIADACMFYDMATHDSTVLAAFIEARVKNVDGQVEACGTIRAILSGYPLSELAKDIAAAFLCVFFVVVVALLVIGVWG